MAMLKWTVEAVVASVAVVATTIGGIYTTSYHWGTVNEQIINLQNTAIQVDAKVLKHDDELSEIKQQNAALQQSLDDIKVSVRDIQIQVRKRNGGN